MATALIDADSIIYKVSFAVEDKTYWNEFEVAAGIDTEPIITYTTDLNTCYKTVDTAISNILYVTEADSFVLYLTGSNNFRNTNPLGYKRNRVDVRKPEGLDALREYLIKSYQAIVVDGMEADDIVVYMKTKNPDDFILCAIDKDVLYQTEGNHYNYGTDTIVSVSKKEAVRFAYYQTLAGDSVDGYRGCPGVGKVKAEKILDEAEEEAEKHNIPIEEAYWNSVVSAYESKGLSEEDAINTMRLASMHQYNGEDIVLWTPKHVPYRI